MPTQGSSERLSLFFCRKQSTGLFLTAGQYLACPGRQETPTQRPKLRPGSLLLPKTVHRTVFNGRTILGLPRKTGKADTKVLKRMLEHLFYALFVFAEILWITDIHNLFCGAPTARATVKTL